MHVTKKDISETEVELTIAAVAEDLVPIKQKIIAKLAPKLKVPGFREGTAPPQLVEKHLDPQLLQTEFLDEAMTELYSRAARQENIRPITGPNVSITKFVPFTTLEFGVRTQIIGNIKLGKYKGLKSSVKAKTVTQKDVEKVIDSLLVRMSDKKEVKRAAKLGDEVVLDFSGKDSKDQPIAGADGKDYPLVLGSKAFIPGFEENLVGLEPDGQKTFKLTFPKDYGVNTLANKKVEFNVKVLKVLELDKPKLDGKLAAKAGPFKTVAELKDDIKKQLENEAKGEQLRVRQNELVGQVVTKSSLAIPRQLIEQQIAFEIEELKRNLTYRGQTYNEFLKTEGKAEDEYKKAVIEPHAKQQVKTSLILSEIAELEQLIITPEELEMQMQSLKTQYKDPAMQAELDKPEARRDIASRMLSQKVVNLIAENSV